MTHADPTLAADALAANSPSLRRADAPLSDHARSPAPEVKGLEPPLPRKPRLRVPLWALAVVGVLIAVAVYIYVPGVYAVETDDAALQADTVSVVPKVAAYVSALHVTDNSSFKAGELLVELDPRDFQAAVDIAAANLQSAQAAETVADAQLAEQSQVIASEEANLEGDRGTLAFATQQVDRYTQLAKEGYGTTERAQEAQSDIAQRQAALQHDTAIQSAAQAQQAVLRGQVEEATANVAHAQAALDQARLNLSYTKIYAPSDGTVASRSVQVGNYVQPGQTLFSAVPREIYVTANFKETQLAQMRVGQPVTIHVDAFPNRALHGHIDSFQRGTGSNFALLPPENATGNFVKIVQRVPVKILIDDADRDPRLFGPGMSVEATVTTRTPPAWLSWLL
jgi:membrane fusion protein, multidrug efflux system